MVTVIEELNLKDMMALSKYAVKNKDKPVFTKKVTFSKGSTCLTSVNIGIILICTSVLAWQGKECFSRFFRRETKAIMTVKPTGETTFLAFTVCPAFENAYKEQAFLDYGTTKANYIYNGNFTTNIGESPKEVFRNVTYNLNEVLYKVVISTADDRRASIEINFDEEKDAIFVPKFDNKLGRCYSMELDETVTQLGVTKVVFHANMNIYIYLHHPGQYMDVDSKSKVYANFGKKVFIDLVYEISQNTLEQEGDLPCNSDLDRTYDDCLYAEIANDLDSKYGCAVPFLPDDFLNDTQICENQREKFNLELLKRYDFLSSNGQRTLCEMPCTTMEVFMGLPFPGIDDRAYIKMYVKSTVKTKKTVYDYTFLSLIAEIGGYTGLLLGVSCVNLTSLIDRFGMRIIKA